MSRPTDRVNSCTPKLYSTTPKKGVSFLFAGFFAVTSTPGLALTTIVADTELSAGSPSTEDYHVSDGATLSGSGVQTGYIIVGPSGGTAGHVEFSGGSVLNGSLNLQQGSTGDIVDSSLMDGVIVSSGSSLSIDSSTVSGITEVGGGSTLTASNVSTEILTSNGGNVSFSDSIIDGHAQDSLLLKTGAQFRNSTVVMTRSIIRGITGVKFLDASPGRSSLVLDASSVESTTGAAFQVGGTQFGSDVSGFADIYLTNNSTISTESGIAMSVINNSEATLNLDSSKIEGDVIVDGTSHADVVLNNGSQLTGNLVNVDSLSVNTSSVWTLTSDATVSDISLSGGSIDLGQTTGNFYQLSVENLSGSGTFLMPTNFQTGQVGFLDVTGNAVGNFQLLVAGTGIDPKDENDLHVVHTASGDANFSLVGGQVDVGTYSYGLKESADGRDWYLDADKKTVSPSTSTVLALFNTTPTVWYGELSTLRSRMGEIRISEHSLGLWSRAYGNRYDVSTSSGVGYQQNQQGISFGADGRLPSGDNQWLAGVMGGYSKSDLSLSRGSTGKVDSYYAGVYTTWLDTKTGYYFDGVLKLNRFQNEAKVSMSDGSEAKGNYSATGVGASAEFGRHIKVGAGYFIEPYAQISSLMIQGNSYDLDNGMEAKNNRTHSMLGKAGATVGRNYDFGQGRTVQPYLRAAYAHEFAKNNEVRVNDTNFNNDLSGSRGELGAGLAVSLTDRVQIHADFDYSKGKNIEQPFGANVGVRYSW